MTPLRLLCCGCLFVAGCGADGEPAGSGPLTAGEIDGPSLTVAGSEACFSLAHDGGVGSRLTWTWGDGTHSVTSGAAAACHAWREPGPGVLSVNVSARGSSLRRAHALTVVAEPAEPRPTASTTIALDAGRRRVWVVNPDADSVGVVSEESLALEREIAVGDEPRTLAVAGDLVAVACQHSGELWLIDAVSLQVRGSVDLGRGSHPFGVLADPRGGRVWVSLQAASQVVAVDVAARAVTARVDVAPDPRGLGMAGDGSLLVTHFRADAEGAHLTLIDARDAAAPAVSGRLTLLPQTGGDNNKDNNGVPNLLNQVVPSPDGTRAFVPSLKANVVSGVYRNGKALLADTTARGLLTILELSGPTATPVEDAKSRYAFDNLDYASSVAFSPLGDRLYVALQGSERVQALDPFSLNVAGSLGALGSLDGDGQSGTGVAPEGLVVSADGARLYVQAFLSRSVRVFEVGDLGAEPPLLAEVRTVEHEPLAADVLLGKQIFYRSRDPRMSKFSYMSCASCHLDGEGDNLVWDFTQRGEGLRNTIPLRGRAGMKHGPLHWSANFDELQDFENDIRGPMSGAGFLPDAVFAAGTHSETLGDSKAGLSPELDALAAYLTSLDRFGISPSRRDGDVAWEAARAQGKALFESAKVGCRGCHTGSTFTDSSLGPGKAPLLHDVGTLGPGSGQRLHGPLAGIDTPTLRGLWSSAPYLHDGSAPTLRAVLRDRNPSDRHGTTSQLADALLTDLETYLLSLDDDEP